MEKFKPSYRRTALSVGVLADSHTVTNKEGYAESHMT